jgi:hypothetical protein
MSLSFYKDKWDGGRKDSGRDLNFDILGHVTNYMTRAPSIYLEKLDDLTYFYATLTPLPSLPRPNYTL